MPLTSYARHVVAKCVGEMLMLYHCEHDGHGSGGGKQPMVSQSTRSGTKVKDNGKEDAKSKQSFDEPMVSQSTESGKDNGKRDAKGKQRRAKRAPQGRAT